MRRRFGLYVLALAFAAPAAAQPFDRAGWIADLDRIKQAITRESPNLEWAVERGLDLRAVEKRARDRLAVATDDAGARVALERFVRAFADGHMELSWPSPPPVAPAARRSTCADLGYRSGRDESDVATRLPGFVPLGPQDGSVRAGTVRVAGKRVGVLRVPEFAPSAELCAAVLVERGMPAEAACDEACADAVSRRADTLFLAAITDRLRLLAAARADLLLLDVAGNGGGNDTSILLARMIGGADIPTPPLAYARTAARATDLAEDEAAIRAGPDRPTAADRALIRRLAPELARARAQAASPCDLSPLWQGRPAGCSNLVRGPFHAGGLVPVDPEGMTRRGVWAESITSSAYYQFTPTRWTGPAIVLVDGNSASSTELLAAMLQDAGRATIVGAPTHGSGCGWTLPRRAIVIPNSGGRLAIPDCARFRRDGRNEIDGIEPDVLVGFRPFDTPGQRVRRLTARLPAAIEAALVQKR